MSKLKLVRVLMIGPRKRIGNPLGGAVVAFEEILGLLLSHEDITVRSISTTRPIAGKLRRIVSSFSTALRIILMIPMAQVVVYFGSNSSLFKTVPFVSYLCSVFGNKPFIIRKFGGLPHSELADGKLNEHDLDILNRSLSESALYLPETRKAQDTGNAVGAVTGWMPNYRTLPTLDISPCSEQCSRFVYVGQVRPEKGMGVLIRTAEWLPDGVMVDVYGPLLDGMSEADFSSLSNIRYCGSLSADQVLPTLQKYDAFVFPSKYINEGHPGSLIEALACGLPIITTKVGAIGEVVTEHEGILIGHDSPEQLVDAIKSMHSDPVMFKQLREAALKRSALFNSDTWANHFAELCIAMAQGNDIPSVFFDVDEGKTGQGTCRAV